MTHTDYLQNPWSGEYKIPWNDPGFSRRMLREHLTQDHDMASRTTVWIEQQVEWINKNILRETPAKILDLGCGPGLYSHRLAKLGHTCHGIDFSPASIAYAMEHNPEPAKCSFEEGDLRTASFGEGYDLVMLLFGELCVFSPEECAAILKKARAALEPGGRIIIEPSNPEAVRQSGLADNTEVHNEKGGLFSEAPHTCITENHWLDDEQIAVQFFRIIEDDSGVEQLYRNTTRALDGEAVTSILSAAGFTGIAQQLEWPLASDNLMLWSAVAP